MNNWTRRGVLAAGAASLSACTVGNVQSAGQIERDVAAARALLYRSVPWSQQLADQAAGSLIIPNIIEGGFVISGAYGEGALQVGEATVDYISMSAAAIGFQIGAQSFNQALFFLTQESLRQFRITDGWELGVDAEVAILEDGASVGASTNTVSRPVVSIVFGQRGLIVGASLEGAKYSRLIRS
ncbi:YSC84-related protein [Algicella marina]|uniref:Twin-arginine translocation pathway signal n=1 Tax=Algicella marina TaxID=2683284 RepID=A0A6P1T2C9_9RHOB|nr:lipid-binding SYLF domain-containing protein [Algicella marina]QHQ34672.1 twin-arginine translocation pathway signal [Algicella marina]